MKLALFTLWFACTANFAAAQADPPGNKAPDLRLTETGRQHHTIHTANREAQAYFDQGLTLLYAFNHEEAGRAFEKAAREKLALDTIQKATKLAEHSPENEQDYVKALAARYSGAENPDYQKLAREYAEQMRLVSGKYPDDLDAATIYAESLMDLNPW